MKRILICEDETAIREFVVINLKRHGYEVAEAETGEQAVELFDRLEAEGQPVSVALLDVMLPGMDGFAVCRALRERSEQVGIIMLTARTQESDKVAGLSTGADDYVTKPFSPSELMARVEALFRRVQMAAAGSDKPEEKRSGEFVLNMSNHTLYRNGEPQTLTQVEFQMLEYFFDNPGKILSRTDILRHVWGESYLGEEKVVDVNMRRLRMKVEENPSTPTHIVTVWKEGYRWIR